MYSYYIYVSLYRLLTLRAIYINIPKQFKEAKLLTTFTAITWQTHVKVSFTDAQTYDLKK